MAKFVLLVNWTGEDAEAKEGSHNQLKKLAKLAGVKVVNVFWTMGRFDAVAVLDGEHDHVAALALALGRDGTVRTETLTAFDAKDSADLANAAGRVVGGEALGEGRVIGGRVVGGRVVG